MTNEEAIRFGNCILMGAAEKAHKDGDFDTQSRTIDFTKTALKALEAQDPHKCPYCSGVFPIKFKYCPECGWYVRDKVKEEDEA